MKSRKKFAELFSILCEAFDRKPLSDGLIEIYWKMLSPFSEEEVNQAINQAVITLKFFPKPAEILEILQGDKQDRAMIAWEKVFRALGRVGTYASVKFDDPVIHSTIELMGGWIELGKITTDEIKWKQKEFEKIYLVMGRKKEHPEHLAGITEMDNFRKGLIGDIPEPVFIGDRKQLPKPVLKLSEVA